VNIFTLGLRVTDTADTDENKVTHVLAESLPSSDRRVITKVQLSTKEDHYVGKILKTLVEGQTVLALGPTKATPDGVLQMQPMLVVTKDNWDDLLAVNLFIATGGLGPKADENTVGDSTVTNRSLAWPDEKGEIAWFKLTAWDKLSTQLSELAPGTPTIAVGRVNTSEKDDRKFLNYGVDKVLYLPRSKKAAPKQAADPDKGVVSTAALGSIDFSL
jgi:hypothetical protein